MAPSDETTTKILGGVPAHVVVNFLREAPGAVAAGDEDDSTLRGDGWECTVRQRPPRNHGSLSIEQVEVTVTGGENAREQLFAYLMPLVMRGGA
ncbi:MAG: DUF1952 domain-containing protein [Alkalispirochaeta sp.]